MDVVQLITATAQRYGVDPRLAMEVAIAESNLNPNVAPSAAGAIGLMQLMPATAAKWGVDPYDLEDNIKGGILELRSLLSQFAGDVAKALGGYNWGPTAVANAVTRWGAAWLEHAPQETRNYVQRILTQLGQWSQQPVVPGVDRALTVVQRFGELTENQKRTLLVGFIVLAGAWILSEAGSE